MSEEILRRALNRGGCRLCMAPDTECVPIFATAAADKEPLSSKILSCISIKVQQGDRMSSRVCHACISFLNSWQSFKNRCYAAQKKQRTLLEFFMNKERARLKQHSNSSLQLQNSNQLHHHHQQQQRPSILNDHLQRSQLSQQRILKDALTQRPTSNNNNHSNNNNNNNNNHNNTNNLFNQSQLNSSSIDVSFIKEEPIDEQSAAENDDEHGDMDPTQFLARDTDDDGGGGGGAVGGLLVNQRASADDGFGNDGPPILTSLGLTHINHVNPFSFLSTELQQEDDLNDPIDDSLLYPSEQQMQQQRRRSPNPYNQPQCTVCNMTFSNRANARRHERNIHGKITDPNLLMLQQQNNAHPSSIMGPMRMKMGGGAGGGMPRRLAAKPQKLPPIVYDYTKPEQYRELLTDSKLYFIKRHIEFLEQYQNMRCKCCNRDFPTYKFFMAHMRKKYDTLSRNLCFKCLKQFETKSLFIAHLKKKSCINLFKVYKADDTISKEPLPPIPNNSNRPGTKEIIANKVYGCKLCSKTFRLKVDFRGHVYETHAEEQKKETIGPACGFCKVEFDDPAIRRRHYNNMECIVFLICGTCDDKFDTLAMYIEHVYAQHLPNPMNMIKNEAAGGGGGAGAGGGGEGGITDENATGGGGEGVGDGTMKSEQSFMNASSMWGSGGGVGGGDDMNSSGDYDPATTRHRHPQNCNVCGKQYNNYYNVLRHMESKHPHQLPRTYRCDECGVGYPRQSEIRDHMFKVHGITIPKIKRETFTCRMCSAAFDNKDIWLDHLGTNHSKYYCHLCDYETENKMEMEDHLVEHTNNANNSNHKPKQFKCSLCQHSFNTERGLEVHLNVMHLMKNEGGRSGAGGRQMEGGSEYDDGGDPIGGVDGLQNDYGDDGELDDDNDALDGSLQNGHGRNLDDLTEIPIKKIKLESSENGDTIEAVQATIRQQAMGAPSIRKCPLCHETFSGGIALANHMRTHGIPSIRAKSKKALLPKSAGSSSGAGGGSLSHHGGHPQRQMGSFSLNRPHVTSRMRCRICQKRIHTKASYKRHMLNVHAVQDCVFIRCTLCPAEFSNDKGLKVHMFRTHNVTVQQMQDDVRLRPVPKHESTAATNPGDTDDGESNPATGGGSKSNKRMFECNICHIVYRDRVQLNAHKNDVHGVQLENIKQEPPIDDLDEMEIGIPATAQLDFSVLGGEENSLWQCRYCDETFNASKKLTIHMNSHEEHDTTDHTCTDCGNVYSNRKSLWVHKNKKHPRLPNPSPCEICDKVFYDKTELFYHLKTHPNADAYLQLNDMLGTAEEQANQQHHQQATALSCHLCGKKFHDKRVLSKHLRLHEAQAPTQSTNDLSLFETSSLAAMLGGGDPLDENGSDYNYPSYQGQMVDGEYACDMCPKTFPLINALKVHRGWHFRSPDGRCVSDVVTNVWDSAGQMHGGGGGSGSKHYGSGSGGSSGGRRSRPAIPPTCPYCSSTFASGNNLRRHIVEVHKRNEAKMMRENGTVSDSVYVEKELECHTCDITFSSRTEWVDHKISHARTMKPSTTYEWGCEICGKVFTRKERLLAHMVVHLTKEDPLALGQSGGSVGGGGSSRGATSIGGSARGGDDQNNELIGGESNSRSSMSSQSQSQQSQDSSLLRQKQQQLKQKMKLQKPLEHPGTADSAGFEDEDDGEYDGENAEDEEMMDEEDEDEEGGGGVGGGAGVGDHDDGVRDNDDDGGVDDDDDDQGVDDEDDEEDGDGDGGGGDGEDDESDNDDLVDGTQLQTGEHEHSNTNQSDSVGVGGSAAYSCDLCQVFFHTAKELRRHVTSHIINGPEITLTSTNANGSSLNQQQQQTNSTPAASTSTLDGFICRLCGSSSESHIGMIQCMENHKVATNLRCTECQLYFSSEDQVVNHERLCHPNTYCSS